MKQLDQTKPQPEPKGERIQPIDPKRKAYTPPDLLYLAPLEAMAAVCDPLAGGKNACAFVQS